MGTFLGEKNIDSEIESVKPKSKEYFKERLRIHLFTSLIFKDLRYKKERKMLALISSKLDFSFSNH
jgi:hypothetical protein